jgi:hypothetical protein
VKKVTLLAVLATALLLAGSAYAQSGDVALGISTLTTSYPSSSVVNSGFIYNPGMGGGAYLSVSGDILPWKRFGIGGEVSWRASQNLYLGYQPYRPIFYNVNGVYAPKFGKHAGAELLAGIGAESLRFYNNYYTCSYVAGCTNYTSSNHFMGVFGGGLKLYPHGGFFVRPEVRFYVIHNNLEFDSGHAIRPGISLGYTFGGESY